MKAEVSRKRDELRQRRIRLRTELDGLRNQARRTATAPSMLLTAFSLGFVAHGLLRRRSRRGDSGEEVVVPQWQRQLTTLGGILLGTALKRGLWGGISELALSDSKRPGNGSAAA